MRFFVAISFFLSVQILFSQALVPQFIDTLKTGQSIRFSGNVELSATSMTNQMLNPLLFGGEISDQTIDDLAIKQRMLNRVGAIINADFRYENLSVNLFKSPKLGFAVQAGYEQLASVGYTDHLFSLAFQGNENFAGKSIDLSSSAVRNIAFQKLGFGVILKSNKSALFVNLINVSNYFRGGIEHGVVNQSVGLDTVSLDFTGSLIQPYKSTFMKGAGLSLDFNYNIPLKFLKNPNATIQVQFKNLGFAYVDGGLQKKSLDTIHVYSGFTVDQLLSGVISKETSLEDTLGIRTSETGKWIGLPFNFQIAKLISEDYEGKVQSTFGIRVYPISSYKPLFFLGIDYRPIRSLHLGAIASYGGFSLFRASFYVNYNLSKFGIGLGTDNIIGMVSDKGFGQSYNFRVSCRF